MKRALDVFFSAVGLVVLLPVFALVALAIVIDSGPPVLYGGMRVGQDGKRFRMWKFRTMRVDSEWFGVTTGKNDARVTRVGRFLRKHKIDELAQLLNVLEGDMSLVGPRPEFEEHTSAYRGEEGLILTVRPGITDYASLRFYDLSEVVGSDDPHRAFIEKVRDEKNHLRVEYVKRQSLGEDFRILFRTLLRVVGGH
ncbi:MAG TPA: sugar transferase [Candidatus Aquilonibacter sp.]|nr:sugar transferase [Candidatus Aquilonibacter sp.]